MVNVWNSHKLRFIMVLLVHVEVEGVKDEHFMKKFKEYKWCKSYKVENRWKSLKKLSDDKQFEEYSRNNRYITWFSNYLRSTGEKFYVKVPKYGSNSLVIVSTIVFCN